MINHYRSMAADAPRIEAFRRAIHAVVKPGDVVADIGSGLGTYAIFACRAGARKVYAIEREDIVLTARQIARDNGCADRIVFLRGDALAVRLPEKADVLITEDFSTTFVERDTQRLIDHARRRFLKPHGRLIPSSATLHAAPVHCPRLYARIDRWAESDQVAYGVDFSATRGLAMSSIHKAELRPAHLLGVPKRVHRVDLRRGTPFAFEAGARFRARKGAPVHGVAVWFELALAPRLRLTNAPGAPATLWGQGFLPLAQPVRAKKGAAITVDLAARLGRDSGRVWWQWEVMAAGARVDGTTFRSFPTSLADLEAGARGHRPGLSEDGEIAECILRMLKAGCKITQVARRLRRRFPGRFRRLGDALARAGEAARRFGRKPSV